MMIFWIHSVSSWQGYLKALPFLDDYNTVNQVFVLYYNQSDHSYPHLFTSLKSAIIISRISNIQLEWQVYCIKVLINGWSKLNHIQTKLRALLPLVLFYIEYTTKVKSSNKSLQENLIIGRFLFESNVTQRLEHFAWQDNSLRCRKDQY